MALWPVWVGVWVGCSPTVTPQLHSCVSTPRVSGQFTRDASSSTGRSNVTAIRDEQHFDETVLQSSALWVVLFNGGKRCSGCRTAKQNIMRLSASAFAVHCAVQPNHFPMRCVAGLQHVRPACRTRPALARQPAPHTRASKRIS